MSSAYSDLVAEAGIDLRHVEDIYLATQFQQGVLHGATTSGRFFISIYHIYLPPHTNLDGLHASWDAVVGAASTLRTGFVLSAQGILAVVYKTDAPRHAWIQDIQDQLEETGMQATGLNFIHNLAFEPFSGRVPVAVHVVGNPRAGYHARFAFHLSIFDELSVIISMKSLNALYHQGLSRTSLIPPTSFASVAAAINAQDITIAARDYWRRVVKDLPDALWPISSSVQSRASASSEILSQYCSIPADLPALRSRTLRAALALTMSIHSGLDDHLFCETLSSRSFLPSHLQHILGPCLSSELVRLSFSSSTTLEQLLGNAESREMEKVVNECPMSLGQILESIGGKAAKKVRVFLTVHGAPLWLKNDDIPGWQFVDHWTHHGTPLSIDVFPPRNGACQIRIRYDPSISSYVNVGSFLDHFVSTLGILSSLDSRVAIPAPQRYTTVQDVLRRLGQIDAPRTLRFGVGPLNNLALDTVAPSYPLIHEMFQKIARSNPDAHALDFEGKSTMSYKELDIRSTILAFKLRDEMGVRPDDMVCILFDVSFEMIIAILAVLKAGGAYVPLAVDLPFERMARILEVAGGKTLLYGPGTPSPRLAELKERFPPLKSTRVSVDDVECTAISSFSSSKSLPVVAGENLAYVIFTSGSTGVPKGVGVEHRHISAFAHSGQADFNTRPGMRKLLLSPYMFDVSVGDIFSTLTSGNTLVLVRRNEILSNLPFWLAETRTTHLCITPSVAHQIPSDGLPSLKHINFVGETLPVDLAARLSQNREVWSTSGITECAVSSTEWLIPSPSIVSSFGERVTIGLPIGHNNIYILRPSTNDLSAIGEVGEICIGGPQVARGYMSDPTLTAAKFVRDPFTKIYGARMFRSGDLGKWNRNGMIDFMGRMDGQVKIRGMRLETGEIETVVSQSHKDVLAVYADVHKSDGEQVLVAVFTLRPEAVLATEKQTIAGHSDMWVIPLSEEKVKSVVQSAEEACEKFLPKYMRPTIWLCLNSFPKDPNGKLNRRVLKSVVQEVKLHGITPIRESQMPDDLPIRKATTETEHTIVSILSQVLGQGPETISLDASFIQLGGTSLQAMRVTTALQACGIGATVADCLDDRKTLAMFAQLPRIQARRPTSSTMTGEFGNQPEYSPFLLSPVGWEEGIKAVGLKVEDVEDVYPFSTTARGWAELALQNEGRSLICQFQHNLGTDIDSSRFAQAWEQLCLIEPSLRTVLIKIPGSGLVTPAVLRPTREVLEGRNATLEVMKLADGKEVEKKVQEVFGEHRLVLGVVPLKNWLILDEESKKWTFASSRHHSLYDGKTLDYQEKELSLLYHQGPEAIHSLSTKRNLRSSFGMYINVLSSTTNKAFWEDYLANVQPPVWPSPKDVRVGYSKDLAKFQFSVAPWVGDLASVARKAGVTKGAVLRAAYAIAIAERQDECVMDIADRNSDVLVYETVEGRGAAGVNEVWGFCTHMDVLRVPVPALVSTKSETTEKGLYLSKLLEVVKDANRNFANTLPAMAQGIEVAAEVLEPKVVKGGKFQTSVLNILDMSGGELSNNSSETETEIVEDKDGVKSIFAGSFLSQTIVGVYLPLCVEIHIRKEMVMFICPYDPDVVTKEDMDKVVQRQIEVLDALSAMDV